MRRAVVLPVLALVAPLAAVAATAAEGHVAAAPAGQLTPVHVAPAAGGRRSTFRVTVTLPSSTNTAGSVTRRDSLTVDGPRRSGCVSTAAMALPTGAAGAPMTVALNPRRLGGRWCAGTFTGVVTESLSLACNPAPEYACPMLVIAPRTIGRFTFRVRR